MTQTQDVTELRTTVQVGQIVRAPKTAELIANLVRRQIVRGELKEGDTLPPEVGLMAQFGVSRPTLREAFRILETESLISVKRGSRGGAQVMAPHMTVAARYVGLLLQMQSTTIVDVYEARMLLEPACARMLAGSRTEADLADMRALVEELCDLVDSGSDKEPDPHAWAQLTYRFHELIMQRAGNKTLAVQGAVLQDIVATHLVITVTRDFGEPDIAARFRRTVRSYTKLIELLEARDAEGAERHWRSQMEAAAKLLLRDLTTAPVVDLFS